MAITAMFMPPKLLFPIIPQSRACASLQVLPAWWRPIVSRILVRRPLCGRSRGGARFAAIELAIF